MISFGYKIYIWSLQTIHVHKARTSQQHFLPHRISVSLSVRLPVCGSNTTSRFISFPSAEKRGETMKKCGLLLLLRIKRRSHVYSKLIILTSRVPGGTASKVSPETPRQESWPILHLRSKKWNNTLSADAGCEISVGHSCYYHAPFFVSLIAQAVRYSPMDPCLIDFSAVGWLFGWRRKETIGTRDIKTNYVRSWAVCFSCRKHPEAYTLYLL